MQRVILRHALRLAVQKRGSTRFQLRYVHHDVAKSQRHEDVKASNLREYAQSAPINISHFRALIQEPDAAARKRHRLRWDWHLRNFLMALMPPAALLIFVRLVEWRLGGDMETHGHLLLTDERINGASRKQTAGADENLNADRIRGDFKTSLNARLMDRLERLEKEMDQLRAQRSAAESVSSSQDKTVSGVDQDALAKARRISKTVVRRGHSPR